MKFRKKPVIIEAFQWTGDHNQTEDPEWICAAITEGNVRIASEVSTRTQTRKIKMLIDTLEGTMAANPGDWIIKGVKGELYPCKPDIFEATYEAVTEDENPQEDNFKTQLLAETREVATSLNKLNSFMASDAFPKLPREDKDLLYAQSRTMNRCVQILGKRLERLGQPFTHQKPQSDQ